MSRDWMADWLDNPIFIKHVRSRLRRQPVLASFVITLALCLCIVWGGYRLDGFVSGGVFGGLLGLQMVILGIMGAGQVGASVGAARASGIMDFHRVSPLSPAELVLGFLFGAPIREYLLFAVTLPFSLLCVACGTPNFRGFVQVMILMIASCWVLHGLTLLNALVQKRQTGSKGVVGAIVVIAMIGGNVISTFGNVAVRLESEPRLEFFGISLPWLAVVLLYIAALLFFIYLAARRKMDSERLHPFSKPQGLAAVTTLGLLILGGLWNITNEDAVLIGVLYALVLIGIVITAMVTPNQAEYYKGLWRARKLGLPRLSFWDDFAINRVFLLVICGLTLVIANTAWSRLQGQNLSQGPRYAGAFPLAIAGGVLILAYHGLALQYFLLRFGRKGTSYLGLFLFFVWALPLVAGAIQSMADSTGSGVASTLFALSPVAGIALLASSNDFGWSENQYMMIGAAVLTPSLLFAFVFNGLVTSAARRVRAAVRLAAEKAEARSPAEV